RYRNVPTFGRVAKRKFEQNVSAMKNPAARDFEDILQCAMSCFEGLLPEPHNRCILDMLFDLATWHAYAKLRVHTMDMLAFFDLATIALRKSIQKFVATTCEYYDTFELPQETSVRGRRKARIAVKKVEAQAQPTTTAQPAVTLERKRRKLNLQTYKFHALGHYPNTIHAFGTTDTYTTQPV
ncbi:hypothetical protein OG21DRAFT_1381054, partial [Imleria badia]